MLTASSWEESAITLHLRGVGQEWASVHAICGEGQGLGRATKALSSYMGHSSITITLDRYGHLMPGNEEEAAALLDTYLNVLWARRGLGGQ